MWQYFDIKMIPFCFLESFNISKFLIYSTSFLLDSYNNPKYLVNEKGLYLGVGWSGWDIRVNLLPFNCRTKGYTMWVCDNGAMRNTRGQYLEFETNLNFCPGSHPHSQHKGTSCCKELVKYNETVWLTHKCEPEQNITCPNIPCVNYGGKN